MHWFVLGLLTLAACASPDLTEIVVTIELEPGVSAQAHGIQVRAIREADGSLLHEHDGASWGSGRYTLVLSPVTERAAGLYRVEATARKDGQAFAVARLVSGYVLGETRYVRLRLDDTCSTACDVNSTCSAGRCVAARVEEQAFGDSRERAPRSADLSVTLPSDAGTLASDAGGASSPPVVVGPASPRNDAAATPAPPPVSSVAFDIADPKDLGLYQQQCAARSGSACRRLHWLREHGYGVSQDLQATQARLFNGLMSDFATYASTYERISDEVGMRSATGVGADSTRTAEFEAYGRAAGACAKLMDALGARIARYSARPLSEVAAACDRGEAAPCGDLGLRYLSGLGAQRDYARAAQLLRRACVANFLDACGELGWMYQFGVGVARDPEQAAVHYGRVCRGTSKPVDVPWACDADVALCK